MMHAHQDTENSVICYFQVLGARWHVHTPVCTISNSNVTFFSVCSQLQTAEHYAVWNSNTWSNTCEYYNQHFFFTSSAMPNAYSVPKQCNCLHSPRFSVVDLFNFDAIRHYIECFCTYIQMGYIKQFLTQPKLVGLGNLMSFYIQTTNTTCIGTYPWYICSTICHSYVSFRLFQPIDFVARFSQHLPGNCNQMGPLWQYRIHEKWQWKSWYRWESDEDELVLAIIRRGLVLCRPMSLHPGLCISNIALKTFYHRIEGDNMINATLLTLLYCGVYNSLLPTVLS